MTSDPVQMLIDAGAIPASPFGPASRYSGVAIARYVRGPGDAGTAYLLRRFIPQRRDIALAGQHLVQAGERYDLLASTILGDPELFWRLADANAVLDPFALTDTLGARIAVPRPLGT